MRRWLVAIACAGILGTASSLLLPSPTPLVAQEVTSTQDPRRARPAPELPAPFRYVVPPTRISPDGGALSDGGPAIFREPHLLVTEQGIATVFMEIPPGNQSLRLLWSCASNHGTRWDCGAISRGGEEFIDSADPWLADTRGDPCPTYGGGITMAAVQRTGQNDDPSQGPSGAFAWRSTDMGRTWAGPERMPAPNNLGVDGTKIFADGRTYFGYHNFVNQSIHRLGTADDPCAWTAPHDIEGGDHPRLTGAKEPGGFAVRGAQGLSALTFNRFGPDFEPQVQDSVAAVVPPTNLIPAFCTSDGTCRTGVDVAQTLIYDPVRDRYHHVFTDRPGPGEGSQLEDLVTRYNFSDDGGRTWSSPVKVAGSGADFSEVGASSLEPTLAWDSIREQLLLAYYQKLTKDSLAVELRVRVMAEDGTWTPPVTVDETPYLAYEGALDSVPVGRPANGEPEIRFGDYFGFQARNGVFHIAHHPLDEEGTGSIAYLSVRYDDPASPAPPREPPAVDEEAPPPGPTPSAEPSEEPSEEPPDEPSEEPSEQPTDEPSSPVRDEGAAPGDAVLRTSGAGRIETAVELSREGFPDGAERVVLARADDFPDALAATTLAAEVGGPVLLTGSDRLADQTAAELDRLDARTVYLAGGQDALSTRVASDVSAMGAASERLDGADRFDTAGLIAREVVKLGGQVEQAIIARADDFADALAAGNVAAAGRAPILLTGNDELPAATNAALAEVMTGDRVIVAGGTAAVGPGPQEELTTAGYRVTRLSGADRYATAVALADEAVRQGAGREPTLLASGAEFPDALAAVPLSHALGGTLLLVHPDDLVDSPATRDYLATHAETIDTVVIAGGVEAVSDQVRQQIAALITDP